MNLIEREIDVLLEKGFYKSRNELINDAYRALLRNKPHLKTEIAISLYKKKDEIFVIKLTLPYFTI